MQAEKCNEAREGAFLFPRDIWLSQWEEGWHLVDRGQGSVKHPAVLRE